MTKFYLYKLTNIKNNKCYIGVSVNPERRKREHLKRVNRWGCKKLVHAIKKYGEDVFKFEALVCGDKNYIYDLEVKAIKHYNSFNNGYNSSLGGEGTDRITVWNKGSKGLCKPNKTSFAKGKHIGDKHPRSKLTNKQRVEIFNKHKTGIPVYNIAKEFNIDKSTVHRAVAFVGKNKLNESN